MSGGIQVSLAQQVAQAATYLTHAVRIAREHGLKVTITHTDSDQYVAICRNERMLLSNRCRTDLPVLIGEADPAL